DHGAKRRDRVGPSLLDDVEELLDQPCAGERGHGVEELLTRSIIGVAEQEEDLRPAHEQANTRSGDQPKFTKPQSTPPPRKLDAWSHVGGSTDSTGDAM